MIVDWALYRAGRRDHTAADLAEAVGRARDHDETFVWIGLVEPTDAEFDEVQRTFELHPLAVEDAVKAHQRPKLERYGDSLFMVLKTARYDDAAETVEIGEILCFVGAGFFISVRHGDWSALSDVRHALEDDPGHLAHGPAAVLHAVADRVVDDYVDVLAGLDTDVDEIEDAVFSTGRHDLAERIYKLKREVQHFRRAVRPLVDPLERLATVDVLYVPQPLREYFRDVADHTVRAADHIVGLDELLNGVLNANLTQISLRQNEDMRRISAWVAIAAVPTLLAGIYGMNFRFMPLLDERWGYPSILVVMALIAFGLYRAFRHTGWL